MRLFSLVAGFAVLLAQPAHAQTSIYNQAASKLQMLQQRLSAMVTENPGEYGIAAMDLDTGRTISFNGAEAFPMASTMKIAVAAAYLAEVDAGRRTLGEKIGTRTAYGLMDAMITRSDNRATDVLIATLGGPGALDRWVRANGLSGMRVDRNIAQLLAAKRDLRDVRDSSTPAAMVSLLRLVDRGSALSPQSRATLLDMMRRCKTGLNRIRGILPAGARVENKTGTLNGYTGDVGYLTSPSGKRIAVAFFARGGDNRPGVIATAARMIYEAFDAEKKVAPAAAYQPRRVTQSTPVMAPRRAPATLN